MIMDSTVTVPDGYEPDSFVVIEEDDTGNREGMDAAVQAFSVLRKSISCDCVWLFGRRSHGQP